jgi:hypothetical protein
LFLFAGMFSSTVSKFLFPMFYSFVPRLDSICSFILALFLFAGMFSSTVSKFLFFNVFCSEMFYVILVPGVNICSFIL